METFWAAWLRGVLQPGTVQRGCKGSSGNLWPCEESGEQQLLHALRRATRFLPLRSLKAHPHWSADTINCWHRLSKEEPRELKVIEVKSAKEEFEDHFPLFVFARVLSTHTFSLPDLQMVTDAWSISFMCLERFLQLWQWVMQSALQPNFID